MNQQWKRFLWVGGLFAGLASCQGDSPTRIAVPLKQPSTLAALPASAPLRRVAAVAGGHASSVDQRGVPRFVWATSRKAAPTGKSPEDAARWHLSRYAPAQKLRSTDLSTAEVAYTQNFGRGGYVVALRQKIGGVEVYNGTVKVLMRPSRELVAISGNLQPASAQIIDRNFRLGPEHALAGALTHLYGRSFSPAQMVDLKQPQENYQRFQLSSNELRLSDPARVKKVYFPSPEAGRLVPAYYVEFLAGRPGEDASDGFAYIVAANDGRVLNRQDLIANEAFDYRVWADPADGRPLDGPQADYTPHPTGNPDDPEPPFIPPNLVRMEAFNTNPNGQSDPWLPSGAVETVGNNVDAYADRLLPDGYTNGDLRATVTGANTFDRIYDTLGIPFPADVAQASIPDPQAMSSTTNLFYAINWLHDYWYDSGFNEATGNAQRDNFRRGGLGGDIYRAEAQDRVYNGQRNNANQFTPADGASPRMQVFVWSGPETRRLTLTPGGEQATGSASFGPGNFEVTATVVAADDGTGTVTDGCTPLVNNVAGQIALIDRGACPFVVKTANAQAAGAVGVIIANNAAGNPPGLGGTDTTITIPTLSITQAAGVSLRAALANGPVTAAMYRLVGVDRDGALDNTVIAHEWGHYIHHRLAQCGTHQCASISEGWGDFLALHTALRQGDNLDGIYPLATYSTVDGYYGIRRQPYSVDPARNPLTLRHIADDQPIPTDYPRQTGGAPNSEVHNAGEIWASMMFEAYVALHKQAQTTGARTFDEVRRVMADYVVAGLLMTPPEATFTEQRDAILAAAAARDPQDLAIIANAFARRGAGSCATVSAPDSPTLNGVVESYAVQPRIEIGEMRLDDSQRSCDSDGVLYGEERGRLTVVVENGGAVAMNDTQVTISLPTPATPGITFPSGTTATVSRIEPFASAEVTFEVALNAAQLVPATLQVNVAVNNAAACETTVSGEGVWRINVDDVTGASANDDVESARSAWSRTGFEGNELWRRERFDANNNVWFGADAPFVSDVQLVSPDLQVGADQDFVVTFNHLYSFEADVAGGINYDGAVIELSDDGGRTWRDVTEYGANPGYNGTITNVSGNPLADRSGYVQVSPLLGQGTLDFDTVTLNFGRALAGRTVRLRFRIGTDAGTADLGWLLDNFRVQGISNAPFSALVQDASRCQLPPSADAGNDRTVLAGTTVLLDATRSGDPNQDQLAYSWQQVNGPAVSLADATSAVASFVAPNVQSRTTLTFRVTVNDGEASANDTIDVIVAPNTSGGPSGCSVAAHRQGQSAASLALLVGAAALLVLRRRRDTDSER
jgi:hypothetical protein